jgi:hypothetical protein
VGFPKIRDWGLLRGTYLCSALAEFRLGGGSHEQFQHVYVCVCVCVCVCVRPLTRGPTFTSPSK